MRGGADGQPELHQERAGHGQDQHRGGGTGGTGAHSDLEILFRTQLRSRVHSNEMEFVVCLSKVSQFVEINKFLVK